MRTRTASGTRPTALRRTWLAAVSALALAAPGTRAEDVALRVTGTGSALGTLQRLSEAFASAHSGHRLRILPSVGSTGAISAVANGALDVGISARPLEAEEKALGLQEVPYARTPLLFAVGPRSGVRGIDAAEMARIYRGERTTWPNGERIRIVMRPRTDVDVALLRTISPEMSAALDVALGREGLLVALTNQECDDLLSRTPGAIGPTSLTQLVTEQEPLVPLAWNGVAPTLKNLASGAYPLSKTFVLVTRVPPSAPVARFLAFLRSPEAARILERAGNLPLPLTPADADAGGR